MSFPIRRISLLCSVLFALVGCGDGTSTTPDSGPRDSGVRDSGAPSDARADAPPDAGEPGDGGPFATVSIFQIQDPDRAGHVPAGAVVRVEGAIVAAIDGFEEHGTGLGFTTDVWVADPTGGPFSGVHVYMPMPEPCGGSAALALGDVVTVEGTIQEFAVPSDGSGRTVTQIVMGRVACTAVGDGVGPAAHAVAMPMELLVDATAEPWEGVLVELSDVDASGDPDTFGTFPLRGGPPVDDDLYRHPGTLRDRFTTLRGIFHYMFGRWALYPRAATDIALGAPRVLENETGDWGCADAADGDGDSAVDCADADCASSLFCRGPTLRVQDLQDATSAMHPVPDTDLALAGPLVVTAIDDYAELAGPGYVGTIVVQDPAATDPRYSGIHVFVPTLEPCGTALALGDRVYVAGRYDEYADAGDTGGTLTEVRNGIVSCRMPGAPLAPTPVATPADLSVVATAEPWEGVLVEIRDVTVTMPSGMFGRFVVTGGVAIDDDLYATTVVFGDRLTRAAGVVTYAFEVQLEPRAASDVDIAPSERTDAACGNSIDDDGDGASDCSDLDCCSTAPCAGAVASRRLVLSEVLYDPTGADDGFEWVELRNAGAAAVPLACYVLGNGPLTYRYSIAQLPPIVIPPGGCAVVGGPDCGGVPCTATLDYTPDLHNGPTTATGASGLALLYGRVASITDTSVPVDAVLYGTTNTAMLLDSSGTAPAMAHVADAAAGMSLLRQAGGTWTTGAPTAGTCTTFTPP